MKKKSKKKPITTMEAWGIIIDQLFKNKKDITEQFKTAKKQYPLLVSTFKIVLFYAGYLERHSRVLSRLSLSTPNQDLSPRYQIDGMCPDPFTPPTAPEDERIKAILAAMKMEEFLKLEVGLLGISPADIRIRGCEDIMGDYNAALDCVTEFAQRESLTSEELEEWDMCIEDLLRYKNELIENNCIREET